MPADGAKAEVPALHDGGLRGRKPSTKLQQGGQREPALL